jgi:transposase
VIQLTPQMRILVAIEPQDFRRGIDGMARVVQQTLESDPFSGAVYVFRNRKATSVKILVYDGQGFWLCNKRLSTGRFQRWPTSATEAASQLQAHELSVLLFGGDWSATYLA